jgi:hypothetical protein
MLIATEDGGPQRGIPFSVPYTSIDYITMEEVNDEYTVVVYTVTGTRKALKQKFSLNRVVELMVRIGKQMEKGAVLDLVDLTGPDDS